MGLRKTLTYSCIWTSLLWPILGFGQYGHIPGSSMENYLGVSKDNPVQLIDASMIHKSLYAASSEETFFFNAMIENLAEEKKIDVIMTMKDNKVIEIPMEFKEKLSESKEIWTSQSKYRTVMGSDSGIDLTQGKEFYIRYEVEGNRFVDDNDGKFYKVKGSDSLILNSQINIRVDCRSSNPKDPSKCAIVEFATRVLPGEETPKIYFTKNHWDNLLIITDANEWYTTKYFYPKRWPSEPSFDDTLKAWRLQFESEILKAKTTANDTVEFVVSYQVDGKTYWDTNFGSAYTLIK